MNPPLSPVLPWGPVVDGLVEGVEASPLETFRSGRNTPGLPVILGSNRDEGTIFAPAVPFVDGDWHVPMNDDDVRRLLAHVLGGGGRGEKTIGGPARGPTLDDMVEAVMARYPFPAIALDESGVDDSSGAGGSLGRFLGLWDVGGVIERWMDVLFTARSASSTGKTDQKVMGRYRTQLGRLVSIITDQMFTCSARRVASALHDASTPVWLYHFTFDIPGHEVGRRRAAMIAAGQS